MEYGYNLRIAKTINKTHDFVANEHNYKDILRAEMKALQETSNFNLNGEQTTYIKDQITLISNLLFKANTISQAFKLATRYWNNSKEIHNHTIYLLLRYGITTKIYKESNSLQEAIMKARIYWENNNV